MRWQNSSMVKEQKNKVQFKQAGCLKKTEATGLQFNLYSAGAGTGWRRFQNVVSQEMFSGSAVCFRAVKCSVSVASAGGWRLSSERTESRVLVTADLFPSVLRRESLPEVEELLSVADLFRCGSEAAAERGDKGHKHGRRGRGSLRPNLSSALK